jgi:exonuclease III
MALNILQWNANGIIKNTTEFKKFLSNLQVPIHVICIHETFLKPNKTFEFPDYNIIRKDRLNSDKSGLLTRTKNNLPFNTLEVSEDIETIGI